MRAISGRPDYSYPPVLIYLFRYIKARNRQSNVFPATRCPRAMIFPQMGQRCSACWINSPVLRRAGRWPRRPARPSVPRFQDGQRTRHCGTFAGNSQRKSPGIWLGLFWRRGQPVLTVIHTVERKAKQTLCWLDRCCQCDRKPLLSPLL